MFPPTRFETTNNCLQLWWISFELGGRQKFNEGQEVQVLDGILSWRSDKAIMLSLPLKAANNSALTMCLSSILLCLCLCRSGRRCSESMCKCRTLLRRINVQRVRSKKIERKEETSASVSYKSNMFLNHDQRTEGDGKFIHQNIQKFKNRGR